MGGVPTRHRTRTLSIEPLDRPHPFTSLNGDSLKTLSEVRRRPTEGGRGLGFVPIRRQLFLVARGRAHQQARLRERVRRLGLGHDALHEDALQEVPVVAQRPERFAFPSLVTRSCTVRFGKIESSNV